MEIEFAPIDGRASWYSVVKALERGGNWFGAEFAGDVP